MAKSVDMAAKTDTLKLGEIVRIYNGLYLLENPQHENPTKEKKEVKEDDKEKVIEVKESLSGKTRYRLAKLQDSCEPIIKAYNKARKLVIDKYHPLLKDLKEGDILGNEDFKKRTEELEGIEEQDEVFKVQHFKLSDFVDSKGNLLVSQKVLNDLSVLIDE